jgi:putative ABC transport system permease protein
MACCVLILLWINDEIRYDRFHEQTENLYRVVNDLNYGPYSQLTKGTAYPLGSAMKEELPEVRETVRLLPTRKILVAYGEKKYYEENFYFADPSLFKIFTFPFIKGDPDTALSSPSSLQIFRQPGSLGKNDPDSESE